MYKLMMIVLTLVLASLACMESTIQQPAKVTPKPIMKTIPTEIDSGVVFDTSIWTPTPETFCAVVTANLSLHIREEPNTRARVIGYLSAGEQVIVDQIAGEWWKISTKTNTGYSNSFYLQIVPCQ